MSLSALTALPRRLVTTAVTTAVGAATHPVATVSRGVGLARGTATGLLHVARSAGPGSPATEDAAPATPGAAAPAGAGEPTFEPVPFEPEPPEPKAVPTPDQVRIAPASVVAPEDLEPAAPEPVRTPEPEPELVYTSTTPQGAEPGADVPEGDGSLLDDGTAAALLKEADTMAKAADPRFGD